MNRMLIVLLAGVLLRPTGPTTDSAMAAEQALARALLANDANAVGRFLADDWAMVPFAGGDLSDRATFLAAIESGDMVRKTLVVSTPRVRLYGNIAIVTSQVATSGITKGQTFDVQECQTDVLMWQGNGWKSVFLHETKVKPAR